MMPIPGNQVGMDANIALFGVALVLLGAVSYTHLPSQICGKGFLTIGNFRRFGELFHWLSEFYYIVWVFVPNILEL